MSRLVLCAFCILLLALATACAKAAKAADLGPDGPPLAMSAPPPRVITPVEEVAVAPPPPPPEPEPAAATPPKTVPPPRARTEPKPAEPPPAVAAQPATPTVSSPEPLEVRSVPSAAAAAEERKVREVMQRFQKDLARVSEQKLSAEGKVQLAQAKRDAEQAEEALKAKNFVYAMALADRAATLAAQLAGR